MTEPISAEPLVEPIAVALEQETIAVAFEAPPILVAPEPESEPEPQPQPEPEPAPQPELELATRETFRGEPEPRAVPPTPARIFFAPEESDPLPAEPRIEAWASPPAPPPGLSTDEAFTTAWVAAPVAPVPLGCDEAFTAAWIAAQPTTSPGLPSTSGPAGDGRLDARKRVVEPRIDPIPQPPARDAREPRAQPPAEPVPPPPTSRAQAVPAAFTELVRRIKEGESKLNGDSES